jgi:hypothetical protein
LETLINPYAASLKCETGEWVEQVAPGIREAAKAIHKRHVEEEHQWYPFASKISVFALMHNAGTGDPWVAEFRRMNSDYREPLVHHGDIPPPGAADSLIELVRQILRVSVNASAPH